MSAISDMLGLSLKQLEADTGGDLTAGKATYFGTAYACTASTLSKGNVLELGGKSFTVSMTLHIRASALGAVVPQTGKQITYGGVAYRIGQVKNVAGIYGIDVGDVDQ
jgi:hypothetical protein